jgi:hypothetical protein
VTNEPDFDELVGSEGRPEEVARLRRVHDLLVSAGPPAELSPAVARPPRIEESRILEFRRRRPSTVLALAAAAVVAAFLIGYAVGERHNGFEATGKPVPMHGVGRLVAARADIKVGSHDSGGNYALQMSVQGLPHLSKGWYELLLSKNGRPTLSCGDFTVDGGVTTIRLSVPYDLTELRARHAFDGWVVLEHAPSLKTARVVMTTA